MVPAHRGGREMQCGNVSVITQVEGVSSYRCEVASTEALQGCVHARAYSALPGARHPILSQPLACLIVLATADSTME